MEGLCQFAVDGLCGAGAHSWIWPTTSGDLAQWIGALGSLLAVGITAGFYFLDRTRRKREELAERVERQRQRRYSAWMQAVDAAGSARMVYHLLNSVHSRMEAAQRDSRILDPLEHWPAIGALRAALKDVRAFEHETARVLLRLFSSLDVLAALAEPYSRLSFLESDRGKETRRAAAVRLAGIILVAEDAVKRLESLSAAGVN